MLGADPKQKRNGGDPQLKAYLAEAGYADDQLRPVLDELDKLHLSERTLVVVVGDHGEIFDQRHSHFVVSLGLPTLYHHGWSAYDELLQRFERHERERALLLAGVSHDLRSPLARIRMAAGLLPEEPASAHWREAIVRNTQVADRLNKAADADKLAEAGSLITTVADEAQRKELSALYDKRAAELNPA